MHLLPREENDPKYLNIHVAKLHKNAASGKIKCPYCPYAFHKIGNLKVHLQHEKCPNNNGITPQTWTDIETANPPNRQTILPTPPIDYFASKETYFGRIATHFVNTNDAENEQVWKCIQRNQEYT